MRRFLNSVVALLFLAAGSNLGSSAQSMLPQERLVTPASDAQFIKDFARTIKTEVELGKLSQRESIQPTVRELGRRLIDDHRQAAFNLSRVTQKKGLIVPVDYDAGLVDAMSRTDASRFERDFVGRIADNHKKLIMYLEQQSGSPDIELNLWARQTLPAMREHLKLATDLDQQLN